MRARLETTGLHAGFRYAVIIVPWGHRCGYVLLPTNHPWHGKHYDQIDSSVQIHGGLTFSGEVEGDPWPEPGYWIGFDCAHCFDAPDPDEMDREYLKMHGKMQKFERMLIDSLDLDPCTTKDILDSRSARKIRNKVYVESQCKQLAAQCHEAAESRSENVQPHRTSD